MQSLLNQTVRDGKATQSLGRNRVRRASPSCEGRHARLVEIANQRRYGTLELTANTGDKTRKRPVSLDVVLAQDLAVGRCRYRQFTLRDYDEDRCCEVSEGTDIRYIREIDLLQFAVCLCAGS